MKKILLGLLIVCIPFLCSSQTEFVLLGGTQVDLQNAINNLNNSNNGFGTITIKGNILIQQNTNIPPGITLNFYTGNKLIVSNGVSLDIKGSIKALLTQIIETNELNHKIKIFNQVVYPEWFGECSYQNSLGNNQQDNIPIQKAFNSLIGGGEIIFNGNEYLINTEINIDTPSIKIKGKGTYSAGNVIANDLVVIDDNISSVFNITTYGIVFSDLNFTKKNKTVKGINATGKALNFIRSNNTKDIDASVTNCRFTHFKYCIYGEGANLKITDSFFGASYIGIYIKEAQFDHNDHKPQTRGHIIDRNRFHSMGSESNDSSLIGSTCIKIRPKGYAFQTSYTPESYTVIGYYNHITNNYVDDCKTFFEGSIDRTKIEGNSILKSTDTAIKAFGGLFGAINDNLIDGAFTWNPNKLYPSKASDSTGQVAFPSGHGIHISYAHFATINNNQIMNKRYHGIFVERSKNSSIQSNTIMNFNRHRFIKRSGENPEINDDRNYCGIYIAKVQDDNPLTNDKYNIQNVISNNTISITHNKVEGNYGIYVGDGDDWNFVKNNFIVSTRLIQSIKIE
ncbi:hypothetical protein HN014_21975 [Aquimarina sp. TRL1]|uniref:right-handed parallel beta-helix repeat-containing protein n=1 Tax=Aquimarina sp. (strain TRL1) TaxID=2736252 RepID=UPI00158B11AF|nr:right-handed parallel beta-helix repeat-containing protein [Aquimarina sp. TRL1]QKX07472.1 hypothetical protein HN014_21975 [Aquimarina sp. TRL1]